MARDSSIGRKGLYQKDSSEARGCRMVLLRSTLLPRPAPQPRAENEAEV